jgi:sialidase-1
MRTVSETTIFRNPFPQIRALDAWHPSLVHLDGDRWFCGFDLAQAAEAHDYRTHGSVSADDGRTWSEPKPLVPAAHHRGSVSMRVSRLRDGRLVGFGSLVDVRAPNQGLLNPLTFGYAPMRLATTFSADGGQTWEPPHPLALPMSGTEFETCHPIVELADGRLLAPTCTWRTWDGAAPYGMKAIAFVSPDGGASWPEYVDIRDDWADGLTNWEQSLVQLSSGALVALTWRYQIDGGLTAPTEFVYSTDGKTFLPGGPTGFLGQTSKMVRLPDDTLLVLYRRHDAPGLWASHARIDLTSARPRWEQLASMPIWDGASSGMAGPASRTTQLSALKFGYPSPVLRPDGDIEVAYWRRVDDTNEIVRIRLTIPH